MRRGLRRYLAFDFLAHIVEEKISASCYSAETQSQCSDLSDLSDTESPFCEALSVDVRIDVFENRFSVATYHVLVRSNQAC